MRYGGVWEIGSRLVGRQPCTPSLLASLLIRNDYISSPLGDRVVETLFLLSSLPSSR